MGTNGFTKIVQEVYKECPESYFIQAKKKGFRAKKKYAKNELLQMISKEQKWQIPGEPQTIDYVRPSKINIEEGDKVMIKSHGPFQIKKKHQYPYKAIGVVHAVRKLSKGPEIVLGTGFIIGPNLVMTCAHNCYWDERHELLSQIEFIPSILEDQCKKRQLSGKGYKLKKIYIPDEYFDLSLKCEDPDEYYRHDYAILVLQDDNLEHNFGSFGVDFLWGDQKKNYQMVDQTKLIGEAHMIGYQINEEKFELNAFNITALVQDDWLVYNSQLPRGMSGAPIFIDKADEGCFIVGFHQRSIKEKEFSSGRKLSKDMFEKLHANFLTQRQVHFYDLSQKSIDSGQEQDLIEAITDKEKEKDEEKSRIMVIDLTYNQIGQKGCQILSRAPWNHLHTLDLTFNNIGKDGCKHFQISNWPNLCKLLLAFNGIGDIGSERLSKAQWPNLQLLDLTDNQIYKQGCFFLAQGKWPKLLNLILKQNQISKQSHEYFINLPWQIECDQQFRSNK